MRPLPPVAQARDAIAERIRRAIRRKYNYCDVEVIGSQRTGLALNISDIDLRLFIPSKDTAPSKTSKVGTVPDKNDNAPGTEPSVRFLYNIAGYLAVLKEYDKPVYEDLEVFYSKVPLLNFYDYRSGLKIQLVSSKDSSAARGKVAQYVEEYPYLPDLYTVVKTMFDARGLSDVFMGGFGSYPIFMMIVASLQHLPRERAPSGVGPALVHFLEYWSLFDTTNGVALDPPEYFDKAVHPVMSPSAAYKLAVSVFITHLPH